MNFFSLHFFFRKKGTAVYSEVAEPNQNPIWNTTLEIRADNSNDNVLEKAVEVSVWDQRPDGEQVFLGNIKKRKNDNLFH